MKIRRTERPLYLAATLLLLGSWLRPATAQLLGPEIQVNSYTTSAQIDPAVAADGSGNFVVAWTSIGQDGSGFGVFGQRFNAAGSPLGSEFQVNTYTTSSQQGPAVSADDSGNFVVAWNSASQDGSGYGVFGKRFNAGGTPLGSEFQANTYTTYNQLYAAVAADSSGNFVMAWDSSGQDGANNGVFGQQYDAVGTPAGPEFQVNTHTTNYQERPAVAADNSGNFVAAWESEGQDGSGRGVFGQRYDSVGGPLGSEFQVNTYTTSSQQGPAVTADGSGNFVVVWQSSGQDGSNWGVFGQRYDSVGSPVGGEFQVNTYMTSIQHSPAVAADLSGNFVVVWEGYVQDGSSYGVFGQRFNSAGSPAGSEFRINAYTTSDQGSPAVAADGSGNFVVVWISRAQDGSDYGVFGQRLSNWILIDGFEAGDACAWSAAVGGGCP